MTDQNQLEKLLDQVADMIQLIKDSENKPLPAALPEGIEENLEKLEKVVELFADAQQKMFTQAGITKEDIWGAIQEGTGVNPKDAYFFDRSKTLERDAREINAELARSLSQKEKKKGGKEDIRARKKKFKRVGGDKGWIPM